MPLLLKRGNKYIKVAFLRNVIDYGINIRRQDVRIENTIYKICSPEAKIHLEIKYCTVVLLK